MTNEVLCEQCNTVLTVQQKIDGGGDTIERLTCPKCGKESYLGRFVLQPTVRQSGTAGSQPKVFHCAKCNIRTAGIVLDVQSECRWCPSCQTPLFQYADCCKQRLEQEGKLCPTCQALQAVKVSKPSIDERTSNSLRGRPWS
ncbi:MAG: hypothetical protein Q7R93_02860 [bacterium]|nr:hypothetical protein [bacterium]